MRLALLCLLATPAFAAPTVDPGKGVTGVTIGDQTVAVTLGANVQPVAGQLGIELGEGKRARNSSFSAGPLHVRADRKGRIWAVALDVPAAGGLVVGGKTLPAAATLDTIIEALDCQAAPSGVACADNTLWFTRGEAGLRAHLADPNMASLQGRWKVTRIAEAPRHMLPRADLKPGGRAVITRKEVKLGASRCDPKRREISARTTAEWLAEYKTDAKAMGFDVPVVHRLHTGCTDILRNIYIVGNDFVAERDGNFYVFVRR